LNDAELDAVAGGKGSGSVTSVTSVTNVVTVAEAVSNTAAAVEILAAAVVSVVLT